MNDCIRINERIIFVQSIGTIPSLFISVLYDESHSWNWIPYRCCRPCLDSGDTSFFHFNGLHFENDENTSMVSLHARSFFPSSCSSDIVTGPSIAWVQKNAFVSCENIVILWRTWRNTVLTHGFSAMSSCDRMESTFDACSSGKQRVVHSMQTVVLIYSDISYVLTCWSRKNQKVKWQEC